MFVWHGTSNHFQIHTGMCQLKFDEFSASFVLLSIVELASSYLDSQKNTFYNFCEIYWGYDKLPTIVNGNWIVANIDPIGYNGYKSIN